MKFLRDNIILILLTVAVIFAGGGLMTVSQNVYEKQKSVQQLDRDIFEKQWDIRSLNAELAFLSRPDRIEEISLAIAQSRSLENEPSFISPVTFSMSEDLPEAMSIMPMQKPMPPVYYARKQNVSVKSQPQKTVKKQQNQPQEKVAEVPNNKASFSSLIDDLGGGR